VAPELRLQAAAAGVLAMVLAAAAAVKVALLVELVEPENRA
jgi:hypothetical protein